MLVRHRKRVRSGSTKRLVWLKWGAVPLEQDLLENSVIYVLSGNTGKSV